MEYLRTLFEPLFRGDDEVEVRCLVFYSLWIGSQFIAVDHNGRSRAGAPIPYTWLLLSPRRERLAAQRYRFRLGRDPRVERARCPALASAANASARRSSDSTHEPRPDRACRVDDLRRSLLLSEASVA